MIKGLFIYMRRWYLKKLKGVCKSVKKCLDGEGNQRECDYYILRSINHEMYLQKVNKPSLSIFDDKSNYLNKIESLPWN